MGQSRSRTGARAPEIIESDEDESDLDELEDAVVYKLRDISHGMFQAWKSRFPESHKNVQISNGDLFESAPAADAIVCPVNSFGFMDEGINMAYSKYFGGQMQERLQHVIRKKYRGEILVGQAVIIAAYSWHTQPSEEDLQGFNEGLPINYLIAAPTMRIPQGVENTVNAYLAFRAVILAVREHNKRNYGSRKIRSVLCPGLGTDIGLMDHDQCANQMCLAYETHELKLPDHQFRIHPDNMLSMEMDQSHMTEESRIKKSSPNGNADI
eukprot:XP_011435986.1 PREDICTED: uncharacterized protein LOC105334291 isoform X1 [Crassostrea gigas]